MYLKSFNIFSEIMQGLFICLAAIALTALGEESNNTFWCFFTFCACIGASALWANLSWYSDYLIHEKEWKARHERETEDGFNEI